MNTIELHRNGINAHQNFYSYYALDSETREQITDEYARWDAFIDKLYKIGYKASDFIRCF